MVRDFNRKFRELSAIRCGAFLAIAPQMRHTKKREDQPSENAELSAIWRSPAKNSARVRTAAQDRGFRTEQAFILAACENELERDGRTDANSQMEARLIASMQKVANEFQALFTLVHAQFALTNSPLQYVLTCTIEPPEEVLPAARARARLRYTKILRLAGQEVATRNKATLEEVLNGGKES